ncbi:hypothetical protein P3X46_014374 [Hevea brasiliensis]|uniref:Protein kinase domain-containing protein n=2 Tax=Hevea brasiliensis TaxID=3981 RepID=A0ABQ9MAD5_HEVBR|nr:hypothetical protein P3X46_014374 [Hevea brasiliensis]
MSAPWAFVFYALFLTYSNCFMGYASKSQNETDRLALQAIKDAISQDPNGVLDSWNTSLPYCQWRGVSCSSKHRQRVTVLDLSSQGLVGRVPAHIGNLSFLRVILLHNNSFHGEIPPEIGKLLRLETIWLSNNSFLGEVPKNLTSCINLREINFIDNNLTGKIPVELGIIPNLAVLCLGKNNFKGKIPPTFGNFSFLILLSLEEASLEGNIPEDIGRLTRLEYLTVASNNLTGTFPSSIYNLSRLTILSFPLNKLKGNLPVDIGFRLPNLQYLALGGNQFTGVIPSSLSNASQLKMISLTGNWFSGLVPVELGRLANLSWLRLGANMLGTRSGNDLSFVGYLTNCTKLKSLLVGGNLLKGSMTQAIVNLSTQISYLSLGLNQIHGTIPPGIGNLVNLILLDMQYLILRGSIPNGIGNLQKLSKLYIPGNQLEGQIPTTLGNLTALYDLQLSQNNLSGAIPPSLGNCQMLLWLDLSENDLDGFIPAPVFGLPSIVSVNLSRNYLTGTLPPNVGNLKQLETLDVSKNKLSGGIPSTLGSCLSLETICVNDNSFEETIPETLSSLRGLHKLDLSHNNLSGMILENFGRLPFLKILNLSFNDLEGEVPQTGLFRNASVISLTGNRKLCGGIPELKLPACTVPHSNKRGRFLSSKVLGPLIVIAVCLVLFVGFFILRHRRRKSIENSASAPLNNQFIKISYRELLQATDGFSNAKLLGSGSYGSVYKGFLHESQSLIAVKVFNLYHRGASKSFISECKALRNVRHRNLLKIMSACASVDYQGNDFRAVIYEFMAGGSLESWLHPQQVADDERDLNRSLNLEQRLSIAIDVASALEYLHCDCQPPTVHSDIKPSNVLLDDNMVAHVGDFGLAKVLSKVSCDVQNDKSSSVLIKGSVGYVAPEYGMGEGASVQGDVYSFGILVLEIFTARRPTDDMFQGDMNLHNFVRMSLPERLMDIVDPKLIYEKNTIGRSVLDCLASVLRVGLSCSMQTPKDRMEIKNVARELHKIAEAYERKGNDGAEQLQEKTITIS